jgi:methyl-accepting chemotaxis protein
MGVRAVSFLSNMKISAANRAQTARPKQANAAVGSMDETIQRNGALVEETSASAESLSEQAAQLAGLIAFFKTERSRAQAA